MAKQSAKKSGVVIIPSSALTDEGDEQDSAGRSVTITKIKYPNNVDGDALVPLYVLCKSNKPSMLVEIVRFSSPYGSWFFVPDNTIRSVQVCSNGNISMVTAVDPLFCALALLESLRAVGQTQVFQPLDSLCITADGTDLSQFCDASQFETLCDVKEAAGNKFYRLSDDKTISWLVLKHQALTKHPGVSPKDAVEVIAQYITPKWQKLLRKQVLGESSTAGKEAKGSSEPSHNLALESMMKDAKESNDTMRDEQDTKRNMPPPKKKKAPKVKVTQKAPPASFWGTRRKSTAAEGSKKGLKRTRSNSSTK